ncbi:hypothetical protein GXW77_10190 [Roseomonas alkaliterrae]|uniref:Sulfotransferase domain-containing protein n=1 Tax=Neoroseomonas alkaliterrae TaxID=1452450 RepID=A0A840YBE9_9PROT|nr:sulfotransferase domain-containing protein [Neoroseomonas alkaliterrae]MBB5691283.1 hypothetical protein [Neoroseomonas alkaliterrae]MBR0676542.1 hypothetical protein [Neoroseomonas alkaliterrae]
MAGASITLVAGYPRSGTTFTAGCCARAEARWHQDHGPRGARGAPPARFDFNLDDALDREAFDRSVARLDRLLVRTHSPPGRFRKAFPDIWARVGRILYVQRHPFEVALSVCRFAIATQGMVPGIGRAETSFAAAAERGDVRAFFRQFCEHRGAPNFLPALGSWSAHLAEWHAAMAEVAVPCTVLSYDRMVREPAWRLLMAATALGLPWREADLRQAAAQMAPERVRAAIGAYFVGESPSRLRYPDLLGEAEIRLGFETFGTEMLRYGV